MLNKFNSETAYLLLIQEERYLPLFSKAWKQAKKK